MKSWTLPGLSVIEAFGYRIIRFWNNDVLANTEGVIEVILRELAIARNSPLIPPLPGAGRGPG